MSIPGIKRYLWAHMQGTLCALLSVQRRLMSPWSISCMQIKDLNSGTFGFVQLARNRLTGEIVAIKFIERGDKVSSGSEFAAGALLANGFIYRMSPLTMHACR